MELHLKIIGVLLICLALIHTVFPRYFNWRIELSSLSTINKEMMYVHTFFIAFAIMLAGIFCFRNSYEIVSTSLGHEISLGFGLFWFTRLFFQFFIYSGHLWKGKRFETTVHIIFSILWLYFSSIFLIIPFSGS